MLDQLPDLLLLGAELSDHFVIERVGVPADTGYGMRRVLDGAGEGRAVSGGGVLELSGAGRGWGRARERVCGFVKRRCGGTRERGTWWEGRWQAVRCGGLDGIAAGRKGRAA